LTALLPFDIMGKNKGSEGKSRRKPMPTREPGQLKTGGMETFEHGS